MEKVYIYSAAANLPQINLVQELMMQIGNHNMVITDFRKSSEAIQMTLITGNKILIYENFNPIFKVLVFNDQVFCSKEYFMETKERTYLKRMEIEPIDRGLTIDIINEMVNLNQDLIVCLGEVFNVY